MCTRFDMLGLLVRERSQEMAHGAHICRLGLNSARMRTAGEGGARVAAAHGQRRPCAGAATASAASATAAAVVAAWR